jgi:undecaprenol kinase
MSTRWTRFVNSFKYASMGILHAYKAEQNIRIHSFIGMIVCIAAFFLKVSRIEWLIIVSLIGGMISLELINTAIERTIDLITDKKFYVLAKQAKDLAAGAVLIYAFVSVIIGLIIFGEKISSLIF